MCARKGIEFLVSIVHCSQGVMCRIISSNGNNVLDDGKPAAFPLEVFHLFICFGVLRSMKGYSSACNQKTLSPKAETFNIRICKHNISARSRASTRAGSTASRGSSGLARSVLIQKGFRIRDRPTGESNTKSYLSPAPAKRPCP
jgi:hypothetical protein